MPGESFLPPWLTFVGCCIFIWWLFKQDAKEPSVGSKALWTSGLWLFIVGSRSVAAWVYVLMGGSNGNRDSQVDGSLPELIIISWLMFSSISILNRRGFRWADFLRINALVLAIYLYFFFTAAWSEYPFVVVKRVVKDLGLSLLVLVIATEPNWSYALRKLFLRVAYVIFPLSIVLIKWFPRIGRTPSAGGESMNGGVTVHKNTLGQVLVVFGLILVWDLVEHLNAGIKKKDPRIVRRLLVLAMGVWLLVIANSQTAVVCLTLGLVLFFGGRWVLRRKSPVRTIVAIGTFCLPLALAATQFNLKERLLVALERDPTLTGRTRVWEIVESLKTDSLKGCGFMMFWDSAIGAQAADEIGVRLNTVHNGYLEVFLDGGVIAVGFLGLMLVAGGSAALGRYFSNAPFGVLGMAYFIVSIAYNITESNFFRLGSLWMMALMAMLTVPRDEPYLPDPVQMSDTTDVSVVAENTSVVRS